jgi:hypothetical protein
MNDVRVGGGRHELPVRLDDVLTRVHLAPLDATEVACIALGACGAAFARAQGEAADAAAHTPWLLDLALELNANLPVDVPGLDTPFNLRTLQNLAAVLDSISWEHLDGGGGGSGGVTEDQRAQGRGQVSFAPSSGPRPQREYQQLASLMLVYTRGCSLRLTARAEEAVARRLVDARRRHRAGGAGGGRVVQATHVALGASEDARSRELTRDLGGASEEVAHLLKQWRRRQVPVGARHGALEFGPVGVDDAENSSLGGGVHWALCRFPTCDDAWGDAAAAPQRGPRHRRLLEELSLAAESRRIVLLEGTTRS